MKKRMRTLLALLLAMAVMLSGCAAYLEDIAHRLGYEQKRWTEELVYTRPDMAAFQQMAEECCRLAAEAESAEQIMDSVYAFFEAYDGLYTNYNLANIRYCADLTDIYWEQEYNYCAEHTAVADGALDRLYYALADSPHRQALETEDYFGQGFFDSYDGESIWDQTFTALMEQENQLISRYYELCEQAAEVTDMEIYYSVYGTQMAQLLVELVAVRQQQAAYVGYDDYQQFAYDFYHGREFTPEAAEVYMERIGETLVPLYRQVNESDVWNILYDPCFEWETFAYVEDLADKIGGEVEEAFSCLREAEVYDIGYGKNKYNSSFEVWLGSYAIPFVFMSPTGTEADQLTFAHEFGHFVNDYLCGGSGVGTDVAEVQSQGMEYMSLCYGDADRALRRYKLADSLCCYVEQAAYGLFEHQLYRLEGEDLTVENVQALYEDIGDRFGFDSWAWDSRDYVTVTHLYTNPMYLISYVVSNDMAFQLYQMERQAPGTGLALYKQCLHSMESGLLRFAGTYGLEDPMQPGRLESVLKTLKNELS